MGKQVIEPQMYNAPFISFVYTMNLEEEERPELPSLSKIIKGMETEENKEIDLPGLFLWDAKRSSLVRFNDIPLGDDDINLWSP